jgi:hypothetical protein
MALQVHCTTKADLRISVPARADQRAHSNKKLRFRSERKLLPLPPPIFDLSNGFSGHFKVQSDTNL